MGGNSVRKNLAFVRIAGYRMVATPLGEWIAPSTIVIGDLARVCIISIAQEVLMGSPAHR